MTKKLQYIAVFLLLAAMVLTLAACGGSSPMDKLGDKADKPLDVQIYIDGRGLAHWDDVSGGVRAYNYVYYNAAGETDPADSFCRTEVAGDVWVPSGWGLRVWPLDADGLALGVFESDIYTEVSTGDGGGAGEGDHGSSDPFAEVAFNVYMDENGFVTWDEVEGAIRYEMSYYGIDERAGIYGLTADVLVENGGVQLVKGYGLEVTVVTPGEDFERYTSKKSGIYGDPSDAHPSGFALGTIDDNFPYRWEQLIRYELISSIRHESVKVASDGSVTFEAVTPKGEVLRYYGHGIKIEEGKILFSPDGFLTALDAIGRIFATESIMAESAGGIADLIHNGGYTFTDATSVDSYLDLTYLIGYAEHAAGDVVAYKEDGSTRTGTHDHQVYEMIEYQPNFPSFAANGYSEHPFAVSELYLFYLDDVFTTGVYTAYLDTMFYGSYLEGDRYDAARESTRDEQAGVDNFYLIVIPDATGRIHPLPTGEWVSESVNGKGIYTVNRSLLEIGELRDANGRVLDKDEAVLSVGCALDVQIGNNACAVSVNVLPQYNSANTLHELVPYAYPDATGTIETLVVPIRWQDDPADMDAVYARFAAELGRVTDERGGVTDHSSALLEQYGRVSLSQYFDAASYGKLNVQSFMTAWYEVPYTFEEMQHREADMLFIDNMLRWLYRTYPDMDWSRFDKDGNGYFDSVILLNAGDTGDEYMILSFGGGLMSQYTYTSERVSEDGSLQINCFTNANIGLLDHYVLIHEFGHNLGLIDYYDVGYSGIDAVGHFDMQSANQGDWNPYSKYAAGWITPEIVSGLAAGESTLVEIGASALTGEAIVIPGAASDYNGTPFDEYILIDLFAAVGNNEIGADFYQLQGVTGVRIYHVNATMEGRTLLVEGKDERYPIGTPHIANNYKDSGEYHVELIQAGKDNTFTDLENLRTNLCADDLFAVGDVFTVESYGEFFGEGLLDDGTAFGYKVEIVGITEGQNPTATIRITRQ